MSHKKMHAIFWGSLLGSGLVGFSLAAFIDCRIRGKCGARPTIDEEKYSESSKGRLEGDGPHKDVEYLKDPVEVSTIKPQSQDAAFLAESVKDIQDVHIPTSVKAILRARSLSDDERPFDGRHSDIKLAQKRAANTDRSRH